MNRSFFNLNEFSNNDIDLATALSLRFAISFISGLKLLLLIEI